MLATSLAVAFCFMAFCSGKPASAADAARPAEVKHRIVFIAGAASHGFGSHEHYAGCRLLADSLNAVGRGVQAEVVRGWPADASVLEQADSIVIYADGGGGHPALAHRDQLAKLLQAGKGFVCLHYAVEVPAGEPGDDFLQWLGGYFETHWSVNPVWEAEFTELPKSAVARGVEPFTIQDEWYFHLRFRSQMQGITPILSAVPPESTMRRPDGPHSGNPAVRREVAERKPQTVAWTFERPGGGRSFGFTGGHFHWNWGRAEQLRLVANAILWTAGGEVPEGGVPLQEVDVEKLLDDQDYDRPKNFDSEAIKQQFKLSAVPQVATPTMLVNQQATSEAEQRNAENAVAGLKVAKGLEVTLVASEPELRSLTNLVIDDRGRIWVIDVMNYRAHQGRRPEGDRILILEDTTGDGVADDVKVYYQGNDINSAMGLCLLGDEVIVSAAPYVWKFTDTDGDDRPDKKVALFTDTGQPQHDHSNHSFVFGPDGKLYWNFGNTGGAVKGPNGEVVVDIHGRPVVDNGRPFYGGMPFRCDLDGSNLEVLAHNFRNNWETTVDSFGTLWQSDNDDDGNRGCRINFVMEQGNYGYRSEIDGSSWRQSRIGLEKEIPLQHWHLNDPGVVPNLLQTGAGSPTGICVYEGRLLPERFWDEVIHCDAGPNVVRAYPAERAGAGYTATIEPILTGTRDQWFRPADVCVAPDGSLFVTDWYDPGVGGHRMGDLDRGRLFRIAPKGTEYRVPKFDYSTAAGAAAALRNPNLAVRFKAWMALHELGTAAEPELLELWRDENPRIRARALWLLGKIEGRGEHYVELALSDADEDIRVTGVRLAKHLQMPMAPVAARVTGDASAAVRREAAIALRFDTSAEMPRVWAELAARHDGSDRWYLEALGIGSDLRSDECFAAWLERVGDDWKTAAGRDIVWRVRAREAAMKMAELVQDPALPLEATDRYFRSLEFHPPEIRTEALRGLLTAAEKRDEGPARGDARGDAVLVRAVERMSDIDWRAAESTRLAVERHIRHSSGSPEFVALVKQFQPAGMEDELLVYALAHGDDTTAVEATELLIASPQGRTVAAATLGIEEGAPAMARLLGLLGSPAAIELLDPLIRDPEQPYPVRSAAVRGMASNQLGGQQLLELAAKQQLAADTRLLAGDLLSRSSNEKLKQRAAQLLPLPESTDASPLPPLDELVAMKGDASRGRELFAGKATCANCHRVAGSGKEVGPDLSEIGDKLSREAMMVSILDPSAGISHNYENYVCLLDSGQIITGVLINRTDDAVTLRTAEAIDRTIPTSEIEELKKSEKSIMPDNLHHTIDPQGLVDLIAYMETLKKGKD
ncbi:PVC-type heme-binding CxxCH protein [Candidatus Laterigemmans baculatus]|uniref:PVC-type heme-binding CxxCH protein n=1 Tax=Candidatus Laterigemmans baculatus TaxID=2770505 RepID=UPI0013DA6A2D|nr:PVC-type heme-binding CxxCH protein [Candidatus Laterigemmans baculatus]